MGTMIRVGDAGSMQRSTDLGETWAAVSSGFSSSVSIKAIATNGVSMWMAGGYASASRKSDTDGASWSATTTGFGSTGEITAAAVKSVSSTHIWVIGGKNSSDAPLVRRSTSFGVSWSTVTVTGATGEIRDIQTDNESVWALLSDAGVHRSTDAGVTWTLLGNPLAAGLLHKMVTDGAGLWIAVGVESAGGLRCAKSTDNGATWTEFSLSSTSEAAPVLATNGHGTWCIASGNKIFRSTDNTATWVERTVAGLSAGDAHAGMVCWGGTWVLSLRASSYNVLRSTDNGKTWAPVSDTPAISDVRAMGHVIPAKAKSAEAPDLNPDAPPDPPADPKTWLVVGSSGAIHRSVDNGATWTVPSIGTFAGAITSVASDDLGRWILSGSFAQMRRSIDNGVTWAAIDQDFGGSGVRGLAASGAGVWVAACGDGKLARSADHGQTWNLISHGISEIATASVNAVATDRAGVWVAVTSNLRVLRSTDNGLTWAVQSPLITTGLGWRAVATDRAGVWVITGDVPHKELRSTDNGATWVELNTGYSDASSMMGSSVSTDRAGVWHIGWSLGIIERSTNNMASSDFFTDLGLSVSHELTAIDTDADGTWIVGSNLGTTHRSTNNGTSWAEITIPSGPSDIRAIAAGELVEIEPIDPDPDPDPDPGPDPIPPVWIAAGEAGKVARSENNGVSWALVDAGFVTAAVFAVRAVDDVVIAAGENGQMRRSDDAGLTWDVIDASFGADAIRGLATNKAGAWVAVGDAGKIRRSIDDGLTWTVGTGLDDSFALTGVGTSGSGTWVAVGELGDIVRSTDNGATWVAIATGGEDLRAVAADGAVWIAVGDTARISRSTNNGVTWSEVSGATQFMRAVFVRDGTWIAAGWFGELLRSTDAGATWALIDAGFGSEVGLSFIGAVAGNGDVWLAASDESYSMRLSSSDGVAWESSPSEFGGDAVHAIAPMELWAGAVDQTAEFDVTIPLFASSGALIDWPALVTAETVDRYSAQLIDPAGVGEPLNLRISSWQGTVQAGRASYLQCVVPAADGLLELLIARAGWILSVSRFAKIGGVDFVSEMARAPIDQIQYSKGQTRATVTLSGYSTIPSFPDFGSRALTGIRLISSGSSMRVRTSIDWVLLPGMTAIAGGTSIVARYINYYVSTNEAYMDVGDRPGG